MKRVAAVLAALCFSFQLQATIPQLVDLSLVGPKEGASFNPKTIELREGETYLFVIENPYDYPYAFVSETFPHSVRTQYIQGSPSVSKNSVQISPHSKVKWLFTALKGGEHVFNAESYSFQLHKDAPGMIKIVPLAPVAQKSDASNEDSQTPVAVKLPTPDYIASLEKQASPKDEDVSQLRKQPRWGGRRS